MIIAVLSIPFLWAATAHEYHVSVTQMQYNPAQKTFEVSIRMFTDDLEKALTGASGQRVIVKDGDKNDALLERYIKNAFVLTDASRKPAAIHYIGKEQEEDATWVYLEIPSSGNLTGSKLQNSTLMEVFDDQVNMTNIKVASDKKTYLFKKSQSVHNL